LERVLPFFGELAIAYLGRRAMTKTVYIGMTGDILQHGHINVI
jgi:hypothetical protein